MPPRLDESPIVIDGSRLRAALLLAGSLIFVLGGFLLVAQADNIVAALVPLAFFAACAAAALLMLFEPPRLEVGPDGIAQRTIWGAERLAWSDVHDFRPSALCIGVRAVGFDYVGPRPRGWMERVNLAIGGVEGMLQPGYRLSPHALADLLNAARERWLAEPGAAPAARPADMPPVAAGFSGARMNRQVFALGWLALGALALALSRIPGLDWAAGATLVVFGSHLYAVRLHDLGRSGWWQLGLYSAQGAALGLAAAAGLAVTPWGSGLAASLQLLAIGALAALPGEEAGNRFGPAPGQPSPIAQAEAFR